MADISEGPETPGGLGRACDQCRARKVRCDKKIPCSNCRAGHKECVWSASGPRKPREAKHRVLISHQYERKIDDFGARLSGIEAMLRNLTASLRSDATNCPPPIDARHYTPPSTTASSTLHQEQQEDEGSRKTFEGNSSMTAHTAFASEFLEQAVTGTPMSGQLGLDMQDALQSLRQMVHLQDRRLTSHESRFTHQKPIPKGGIMQLPLPPGDVVRSLLREIRKTPPLTFMMSCTFLTTEHFIDSCREVYFATDDFSLATFIIVNAGLYYLFQEKAVVGVEAGHQQFLEYHYICRDNLETALANLPLLLPTTRETIEALLLGVTYAVETSKFSIAWKLNSTAAEMCQTLGWHRRRTAEKGEDGSDDKTSAIFWFCYMLDKGLALRFGRTPVLQDWDISIPRSFGDIGLAGPWKDIINVWISSGEVLGEVYQHLYSPSALALPREELIETARRLVEKMKTMGADLERLSAMLHHEDGGLKASERDRAAQDRAREWREMTLSMILKSGQVGHLSSLTLIYRAIPNPPGFPGTFNAECIEAARLAFRRHQECMALTSGSPIAQVGYLHWTVLYTPFTPFIVLLCHVIETSNLDDLRLLDQFTSTLLPVLSMSQAIEKMHRLCRVLHRVAALYVDVKTQQQQGFDMGTAGSELDAYLTQLGFIHQQPPPPSHDCLLAGGQPAEASCAEADQVYLGDWFTGNSYVMSLIEGDMLDFDSDAM